MSAHAALKVETEMPVFFADSQSPWQRPTNENSDGLLRQYYPKGTDLSRCPPKGSRPSRMRSTPGHVRPLAGRHQQKHSASNYGCANNPVLQGPFESSQYTAVTCTEHLELERFRPSIGTVADA